MTVWGVQLAEGEPKTVDNHSQAKANGFHPEQDLDDDIPF